jgi:hypothetical protein
MVSISTFKFMLVLVAEKEILHHTWTRTKKSLPILLFNAELQVKRVVDYVHGTLNKSLPSQSNTYSDGR